MATDIETKIVEAQFRSEDFDKNIRKSTKNLEDFKRSLRFDDAANQMRQVTEQGESMMGVFSNMASNIEKLSKEFTGIGSLSMYVAQKVKSAWQDAMHSVEGFMKSLTTVQMQEGSNKYNGLLKSVQTIKNATGDAEDYVYQVMQNLNKYTDETSYNFSDMAANIGKFTTAGVKLEDAEKEMEGIANWAALAGQGVNEAQRAMYNISQAMSAGYMKLMDYRSIQNANMDIRKFRQEALKAAVAVGALTEKNGKYYAKKKKESSQDTTSKAKKNSSKKKKDANSGMVEVNLDNFTETLQYGWFNKEAMENVFKVFADNTKGIGEEAYKAAQRCVTFTDALNAIKDMLSTGWMNSYQSIFGKLSDAMNLFSGMCNKASEMLSKFVETRNKILDRWSLTGRNSLWGALVGEIETPDGDVLFKGMYGILDALDDLGNSILESFWNFVRRFADPAETGIFDSDANYRFNFLAASLTHLTMSVQDFTNSINTFLNSTPLGQTETRADQIRHTIEGVFAAVSLVFHVITEIGRFGGTILAQLEPSFQTIGYLIGYLAQLITGDSVDEIRKNNLGTFLQNLATVLKPVTSFINSVVKALATLIATIAKVGSQTGISMKVILALPLLKILKNLGLFHVKLGLIAKAIGLISFVKIGGEIAKFAKSTDLFKKITLKSGGALTKFLDILKKTFGSKNMKSLKVLFTKKLANMFTSFPNLVETVKSKLTTFAKGIVDVFSWFFETLIDPLIGNAKAEGLSADLGDSITRSLIPGGDNPSASGESLLNRVRQGFVDFFKPIKDWFSNFFNNTIPNILNSDGVKAVKDFFSGSKFMDILTNVVQLKKWSSMGKIGAGLVSLGKGFKWIGKGGKVFGKNLKNLNLVGIFKDMFNVSNIINSNNNDNSKRTSIELGKFGSQLLQIAAAVGVLVLAANKLIELDQKNPNALANAGIALAGLLGGLILAGVAAKYLTGNGTSLLAIAVGIGLMVKELDWLFNMPPGEFEDAGLKLVTLMGALAAAMFIATGGVFGGTRKLKGVIGFALAMCVLMIPVKSLAGSAVELAPGIWKLVGIMAAIAAAAGIMGLTKFTGFKGMIRFALAMTILLVPIKALANMDLWKATQGIGYFIIIAGTIAAMANLTNDKKISKLSGLVGALAALSLIGWIIGKSMDWKQVLVGFGPIIAMLAMLNWFLSEASKLKEGQINAATKIFKTLAAMIAVTAGALILLDQFELDWTQYLSFFGGIVALLVAAGAMLKLANNTKADAIGKITGVLGMVILAIIATAGSLVALSYFKVDWKTIAAFMGGLVLLIAALGVFLPILGKLDPGSATTGVLALGAAIIVIMGAISLMSGVLLGAVGNSFTKLSAQLKTMGGLLRDFFNQTDAIKDESTAHAIQLFEDLKTLISSFEGFGDYTESIRSVTAQLMFLSTGLSMFYLNDGKYPDPENSVTFKTLNKFIDMAPSLSTISFGSLPRQLMYLGSGLNLFDTSTKDITNSDPPVLGLLTSISDIAKAGLGTINYSFATGMMYLGTGLNLFHTATKDITSSDSPALGLLQAISSMAKEGTGSWDNTISGKLMYLGASIGIFSRATSGVTSSETPVVGLLQNLFGQADNIEKFTKLPLDNFSSQLSALGGAMSLYAQGATEATGLAPDKAPDVTGAIEILKAICTSITGEDGTGALIIPNNLPDEQKLGLFAGQLAALAMALTKYANAANSFKGDSATKSIELLKVLGEIGGYLTKDNLEATKAFTEAGVSADGNGGTTSLGQFALDVEALGVALAEFSTLTSNTTFDGALGALAHLSDINNLVTKDYLAFINAFDKSGTSGKGSEGNGTPLGMFALDIGALGTALNSFSILTSNTTFDSGALGALSHLAEINGLINQQDLAFVNVFKDSDLSGNGSNGTGTPLGMFALDIQALGSALNSFSTLTSNTSFNNGLGALDKFGELNSKLTKQNLEFVGAFTAANVSGSVLSDFATDIGNLGTGLGSFAENITNTDGTAKDFNNALKALNFLVTLKARLPDPSAFLSWFNGKGEEFSALGTQLQILGQGLHDFSAKMTDLGDGNSGINMESVQNGLDALTSLVHLMDTISYASPNTGGLLTIGDLFMNMVDLVTLWSDSQGLLTVNGESLATGIARIALDISNAFSTVKGIDADALSMFSDLMSGLGALVISDPSIDMHHPGEMIVQGMAEGVAANGATLTASITSVIYEALDAVHNIEYTPIITPIIDLSNVTGDTLDDLFGGNYQLNLGNALNRAAAATSNSGPVEVVVQNQLSLSYIQSQINSLQGSIESLGNAIANMQIVLNTGVVAGGVTDDVDINLGRKNLYASRRN